MGFSRPKRVTFGAIAGAAVGAVGGIFALGSVPAILVGDPRLLFNIPVLNVLAWVMSLFLGWKLGGVVGWQFGRRYQTERAEIVGGAIAGLFTILLISLLGWFLWWKYVPAA